MMLLTCKDEIEEFALTEGRKPKSNLEICKNNGPYIRICSCTKYDMFQLSTGMIVPRPYLRIESEGTYIGLGVEKAKSIIQLWPEIEAFIRRTL